MQANSSATPPPLIWMTSWSIPCATRFNNWLTGASACEWSSFRLVVGIVGCHPTRGSSLRKPKGDQYAWSDSRVSLRISLLPHLSGRIFVCDRFRRQHRSCSKDDRFGTDGAADKSAHYQRHFAESLCSAAQRNGATMVQARLEKNRSRTG